MIETLPGVNLIGLHPKMQLCNCILTVLYYQFDQVLVITSAVDGVHTKGSLHPKGRACDYRIWYFTEEQLEELVRAINKALGPGYDVVMEADHLHIEYDPDDPKAI